MQKQKQKENNYSGYTLTCNVPYLTRMVQVEYIGIHPVLAVTHTRLFVAPRVGF